MRTSNDAAEACREAESKILQAQEMLAGDARPETVEQCAAELAEAAELLRALDAAQGLDAEASASLERIRTAARQLGPQMQQASQLCLGWMQLRLGTGYTLKGSPVLAPPEAETLFEG
jgi:hypothetical protein